MRVTAAGFLSGRVKGGSARESVVDVEGVLMLPESIRRRLDSIRSLSRQGKRINGLFRLMLSPLLWEQAYAEIAPNRGALTRGVTDNTLDGFSLERVHTLISRISAGTYRFTPIRRVYIPKPDGKKMRPLGVPTADDKLVQGVVKLLLEAIYEPAFSPRSHGFRRNRSCHTALSVIQDTWNGVKWLVDIDVVGFFDNIDSCSTSCARGSTMNGSSVSSPGCSGLDTWKTGPSTPPSAAHRRVASSRRSSPTSTCMNSTGS